MYQICTEREYLEIYIQYFNSRDDNFPWNYFFSKGQFQIHFSQLLIDSVFLHSYGGQYTSSTAPNKRGKIQNQLGAEKSGSENLPNLTENCRL